MKYSLISRLVLVIAVVLSGSAYARDAAAEEAPAQVVINTGGGGHNTRNLLGRIECDVLAHRPSLVILMVGTNDILNHSNAVPLGEYESNLRKLVSKIKSAGAHVVLMTILPCYEPYLLKRHPAKFYGMAGPTGRIREANLVIHKIAKEGKLPLVDAYRLFDTLGNVGPKPESLIRNKANSGAEDGVHPTPEGYRLMAIAIHQAIADHKLPAQKTVCFGDSITVGTHVEGEGTAEGQTYPAFLVRVLRQKTRQP